MARVLKSTLSDFGCHLEVLVTLECSGQREPQRASEVAPHFALEFVVVVKASIANPDELMELAAFEVEFAQCQVGNSGQRVSCPAGLPVVLAVQAFDTLVASLQVAVAAEPLPFAFVAVALPPFVVAQPSLAVVVKLLVAAVLLAEHALHLSSWAVPLELTAVMESRVAEASQDVPGPAE